MIRNLSLLKFLTALTIVFTSCRTEPVKEEPPVSVKITKAKTLVSSLTKSYPGKIRSASEIKASFRVSGPITEVNIDEGDMVKKGEVLARIDPRDYQIQLEGTEAKYKEVKAEVKRITALYNKNKISENDYDKAVSGLNQITAKYKAHKNALNDTRLKAPFTGQVNKIYFEKGEMVDAGIPVFSMIDTQNHEIVAHIPASDYLKKERFTSFSCHLSNAPEKEWPIELRNIVSQPNLNGLYPVYFNFIHTKNENILPGMSAEIIIKYRSEDKNLYEIPSSAIFEKDQTSNVWIFQNSDSTLSSKKIEIIKIKSSGSAVVKGDFISSENIISAGVKDLQEGQKVTPLPPPSDTNIGNLL